MKWNAVQLSRLVLGLSWIYHGLFPKLLFLAPLELEMSGSIGLSEQNTLLLIRVAGVAEILFGLLIIVFYRNLLVLCLNIASLLALMAFVLVMTPHLLVEAFNPVTTNVSLLALSLLLVSEAKRRPEFRIS